MEEIIKKNNAFFRQLLFLALLITIGLIISKQLGFFLGSFLGAITIYIVLRNVMFKMTEQYGWRRWLASLVLVLAVLVVLGAFGYLMIHLIASEVTNVNFGGLFDRFNDWISETGNKLGITIMPKDILDKSEGILTGFASGALNTTYSFAANIFMMLIILYFMLTAGHRMEAKVLEYMPLKGKSLIVLQREVKNMIYSNAVGMPLILVAQTLTSSLIYWLLGMDNFFFWGFLTAIAGLLPLLGTAFVYVPLSIWFVMQGQLWAGIGLLLYGLTVISNTDNVFRIILMKKVADTHPLVVIFGVLLGIPLFGFWGIIFGPLFISSFMLLIKIYYVEYGLINHDIDENAEPPLPVKKAPKHFTKIVEAAARRRSRSMQGKNSDAI